MHGCNPQHRGISMSWVGMELLHSLVLGKAAKRLAWHLCESTCRHKMPMLFVEMVLLLSCCRQDASGHLLEHQQLPACTDAQLLCIAGLKQACLVGLGKGAELAASCAVLQQGESLLKQ